MTLASRLQGCWAGHQFLDRLFAF